MAFITIATGDGAIECTLFPKTYKETLKKIMNKNTFVRISARKDNDGCIVSKMEKIAA
jgi:DNA polymerase III alpha subunit